MRYSATSANPQFRFGMPAGGGQGNNPGTLGSAIGMAAHGQFGNRVMPMQFVRHGSAERGSAIPRRQRSRDRSPQRNRTISPAQAAELPERTTPAGRMEATEWLEALQAVDERVRVLENRQTHIAQGISRNTEDIDNMKKEFHDYRQTVAADISAELFNNPTSFKTRIDGI